MIFLYCLWWLIINKPKPNLQGTFQGTPAFRGHLYSRDTCIWGQLYSGDTCIQGTPLFKGHLHSGDTSIQGTPAFRAHLYSRDTCIQGTPLFKGHLHLRDISIQGTSAFRGHLCSRDTCLGPKDVLWIEVPLYFHINIFRRNWLGQISSASNAKINY